VDPKNMVTLFRRWLWLLIIGGVLGSAGGYFASKILTPVYEASTKVLVNRSRQQSAADILVLSDQQLVLTYQQLLKTRPLLNDAEARLGINIDPDHIKVDILPGTQIVQIDVQDENAEQAVTIANTLVQILIEQNETLQAGRYTIYEESLNSQIDQVQAQIDSLQSQITQINQANVEEQLVQVNQQITDLQDEIANLEKDIAKYPVDLSTVDRATLAEKQAQLDQLRSLLHLYQQIQTNLTFIGQPMQVDAGRDDPRISTLQSTRNLYQQLYLNLLNNLETVKLARVQSTPTVSQIEVATIPEKPVRPIPWLYTALSGIVGVLLALGAILLIDYFDDTLKSPQKIQEVLGIPVIGEIIEADRTNKGKGFYLSNQDNPLLLNAFGILRINVSRLMSQRSLKTILVASSALGEGKTTISANLAEAFVQSGKKVVLIDADLYHPAIHTCLGLDNQKGLTDVLAGNTDWQAVAREFSGITVITSGMHSSSPTVLLESDGMTQLLENLQKKADVVILDGPPLFVMDTQILASKVGGILLVIRQGNTLTAVARAMVNQLNLMDANLLGIVLNRVPRTGAHYPDGYRRFANYFKIPKRDSLTENVSLKARRQAEEARACPYCQETTRQNKAGKTSAGKQRYRCMHCGRTYTSPLLKAPAPESKKETERNELFTLIDDKKIQSVSSSNS
jgi:succinoglycan biosynthesis transport protein ExoP